MAKMGAFDVMEAAKKITIHVKITGVREFWVRLWIARWLIALAVWITGMGFQWDGITEVPDDA